jgi:prepilin-type N-terminal cleavage/methylation domain-containing protein
MYMFFLRPQRGFTIIELVLVIMVIAILATFAAPKLFTTSITTAAQAQQLCNDIKYTQALSMTSGQRYYLIINSSTTYQIRTRTGTPIILAKGATTQTLAYGISFATLTNLPNNLIEFDGKGSPYIDTALPGTALVATATIPLVGNGQTSTITISPETGRVAVT